MYEYRTAWRAGTATTVTIVVLTAVALSASSAGAHGPRQPVLGSRSASIITVGKLK